MESSQRAQVEKEYTIQHFGFDPNLLVEELTSYSLDTLSRLLDQVKVQIKTRPSGKFKDEELDKGIQALQEKYSEFFERKLGNLGGYLDKNVFKIPGHVLLPEDAAWDGLSLQVAKSRLTAVNMEMEKMRENYKSCLYKKTYLRSYLDKLKQICTSQEEAIQQEVGLKEQHGLMEGEETVRFLASQTSKLQSSLASLNQLRQGTKRPAPGSEISRDKRQKLELDFKTKLTSVKAAQLSCAQ